MRRGTHYGTALLLAINELVLCNDKHHLIYCEASEEASHLVQLLSFVPVGQCCCT